MPVAVGQGAVAIVVAATAEEGHDQAGALVGVPVPHSIVLIRPTGASVQMSRVATAATVDRYCRRAECCIYVYCCVFINSIRSREEFPGLLTRTSATSALALNGGHVEGEASQEENEFHCEEVLKNLKQFQLINMGKCRRFYSKSSVHKINSLTAVPQFC